ncbi:hypothetical protein, partial [Pseudomonas viridiflava]
CYPMSGDALTWVRENWSGPAALLPRVRGLFGRERNIGTQEPAELIAASLLERREALAALKAPWTVWTPELQAICMDGVARKIVDGRKMQERYFRPWFEKLAAWAADEA